MMMNRDAAIRVNTGVLSAAASMAVLCCGLFMCATSALGQAANAPADDAALAGRWRVRLTWPTGHPEDHRQAALRQTYRIPAWDFAGGPTFSRSMPSADSPAWEVARGLGGPDLGPTLEFTTWTLAPTDGALRLTMTQSLMFADGPGWTPPAQRPCTLCNGTGYHGRAYVPGYMGERGSYVEKVCPTCDSAGGKCRLRTSLGAQQGSQHGSRS